MGRVEGEARHGLWLRFAQQDAPHFALVRGVQRVDVSMDHAVAINLLFDPDHGLDERILSEQFGY